MRMHFVVSLIKLLSLVAVCVGTPMVVDTPMGYRIGTNQPCDCGPKLHSSVALMDPGSELSFCSGTMINYKQVLTLARCVTSINPEDFKVVVKQYKDVQETAYTVVSIVFHTENYNPARDIAIVNIARSFSRSDRDGIVCLPFGWPIDVPIGQYFSTAGWYRQPDPLNESIKKTAMSTKRIKLDDFMVHCVDDDQYLRNKSLCTEVYIPLYHDYEGGEPFFKELLDNLQVQFGIVLPRISRSGEKVTAFLQIDSFLEWIKSRAPPGFNYCKVNWDQIWYRP